MIVASAENTNKIGIDPTYYQSPVEQVKLPALRLTIHFLLQGTNCHHFGLEVFKPVPYITKCLSQWLVDEI